MLEMLPKLLKKKKKFPHKYTPFFLLICLLYLFSVINCSSACTEQWTELDMSKSEWTSVGDASAKTNSDGSQVFEFGKKDTSSSTTEIGGAVWNSLDFSQKRGLLISFKPTITLDELSIGSQKIPQGLAIVITSSSTKNLIGTKGSGISYEGIQNAVAFEFDFYRDTEKNDDKDPHFSVHSNPNGEVSANEVTNSKLCNIAIPNFYDSSLDDYVSNIVFEIQVVGKKLTVKSNHGTLLDNVEFSGLQELLEQKEVSIGITASMKQNKIVTISDFKVSEVFAKEQGELSVRTTGTLTAGNSVNLYFGLLSTCGEALKVSYDEYTGDSFKLIINGEEVEPETKTFDDSTNEVKMTISETKVGTYTALVKFKDHLSTSAQFTYEAGTIQRFEICPSVSQEKYQITSRLEETKDYFIVPICSYDQYGNSKVFSAFNYKVKVQYPKNFVHDNAIELSYSDDKKTMYTKIYISIFGKYEIFSEYFVEERVRTYELTPTSISPEKSLAAVLYDIRVLQSGVSTSSLFVQLQDTYGRLIPKYMIESLKCSFDGSYVLLNDKKSATSVSTSYLNDDNVILTFKGATQDGKYSFVPIVKCTNIASTQLTCQVDQETKESKCDFYKETTTINKGYVLAYSDLEDKFIQYGTKGNDHELALSLDEYDNPKITELVLLDSNGAIIHTKSTASITAKIDSYTLTVVQVGNRYHLYSTSRKVFNPASSSSIVLGGDISAITIPVRFFSKNRILSNIFLSASGTKSYIAFYKQDSMTLKASENYLLFEIFEYYDSKYLGDGSSLDITKVNLKIGSNSYSSTSTNAKIAKYGAFISVSSNVLTTAGKYSISLSYDSKSLITIDIVIESNDVAYSLGSETGTKLSSTALTVDSGDSIKLTILDKFGNVMKNNKFFTAFGTLKIVYSSTSMKVRPNYDNKIAIINNGKSTSDSVSITLIKGSSYTVTSTASSSFTDVDASRSYGYLKSSYKLTAGESVSMSLYLLDSFGNKIVSKIDKTVINVYALGKKNKEIIELTSTDASSSINGVSYKAAVTKEDDYQIKVFINEFPVECKGCNFRVNHITTATFNNIRLYILANKKKIPAFPFENKPQILNKNRNFVFYLEFNDKYYNEYSQTKTYSLYLTSSAKKVQLCPAGTKAEERGYYKVCSDSESTFNSLTDGIYYIQVENIKFYFNVVSDDVDGSNSTPVAAKSMIMSNETTIYGKTNAPGFFILDLRNSNNKRFNADKSKVSIVGDKLTAKTFNGPEPGLLTVFIVASEPGTFTFKVNYNSQAIISDSYTYICGCSIKSLTYSSISSLDNGYYAFYKALDYAGKSCKSNYAWNEIDEKNTYANLVINAYKTGSENSIYKPKVYYNHLTGVVTLFFDNHVSGSLTLTSSLVDFGTKSSTLSIPSKIIDKDHFYASLDSSSKKVTIKLLNDNYETIAATGLTGSDFGLAIARYLNDDYVTIKSDFSASSDYSFSYDSSLLDAAGQYLFIVYYKGEELFCENCLLSVSTDTVDVTKTQVYHKKGNNMYIADSSEGTSTLFRTNFPFFRINLYSKQNNLIIPTSTSAYTITLKHGSTSLGAETKIGANGNIYVYLTDSGRETYLSLTPMSSLTLSITSSSTSYTVHYLLMNGFAEIPSSNEKCYKGAEVTIVDIKSSYIKKADEYLEFEVLLDECASAQTAIQASSSFGINVGGTSSTVEAIPTDVYGGYILLVPYSKASVESQTAYLTFNSAKSSTFKLTVLPGYAISGYTFSSDSSLAAADSNNKFAYALVDMTDSKGNSITNMGRNLFANDFFGITATDASGNSLPYKVSYDSTNKKLKVQAPVSGAGKITFAAGAKKLDVTVGEGKYYTNALAEYSTGDDSSFTFTLSARDAYYKSVSSSKIITSVKFRYFSINALTEEVFSTDLEAKASSGKYTVTVPSNYPKYQIYGFVPLVNNIPQVCSTCIFKNALPKFVYTVDTANYLPHNIGRKIYLIKNIDSPLFIYSSESAVEATATGLTKGQIISEDTLSLLAFDYSSSTETSLSVKFSVSTNSVTLSSDLIEYSSETLGKNDVPAITERYGFNSYLNNKANFKKISFFMELRNDQGVLLKGTPTLYTDDTDVSFTIISTSYQGIFFVIAQISQADEFEYTMKFKSATATDGDKAYNTFHLYELASFPVSILLFNKEELSNNVISYKVLGRSEDSEEICDDRLNLYADVSNLITDKVLYKNDKKECILLLQFSGDVGLESSINNFSSDLSNSDNSIYSVNPHNSGLVVNPNVVSADVEMIITFNEKLRFKTSYASDEKSFSKELNVYKYYTPTKYELVKKLDGLYGSSYSIKTSLLNIENGVYALVGSVADNNIYPVLVTYSKTSTDTISSIKADILSGNDVSKSITNIGSKRMSSGSSLTITYPFSFRFKGLNSIGNSIEYAATDSTKMTARIVVGGLTAQTTEEFTVDLVVRQYNSDTFIAEVSTEDIRKILHAPVILAYNKNYFLEFIYSASSKYTSFLSYTYNAYQAQKTKRDTKQYQYPTESTTFTSFSVMSEKKGSEVYIPFNTETTQHACIFVTSSTTTQILNAHLDPASLKVSAPSGCTISVINSYLGCFAFSYSCETIQSSSEITVKYKDVANSNKFYVKQFLSTSPTFKNLKASAESYISGSTIPLTFTMTSGASAVTEISSNYFNVFVNGEQLLDSQFTLTEDSSLLKCTIESSFGNTIPKEKQIMIVYTDGVKVRVLVVSSPVEVIINQPEYAYSATSSKFSYKLQVPINLKVGETLYLYLLVKDTNHACYFGDETKIKNIKAKITINKDSYTSNKLTPTELDGVSACEKVYKMEFENSSSVSGDFPITLYDGTSTISSTDYSIYIVPADLDAENVELTGGSNVKAGDRFELYFTGTDKYGNALNYFDIADDLDIKFINQNTKKEISFDKKINAAVDNSKVIFACVIDSYGTYDIKLYYKGSELKNYKGLHEITVSVGECSLTDPDPQLTDIDGRNTVFYSGEEISINLVCKDELGNDISSQGSEIFTASIKLEGTDTSINYDKTFENGRYYFSFTPSENGKYTADISLNGKKYGNTLEFEVKNYDYDKYMCMDKRQFDKIEQCENTKYDEFVASVLGKEYVCDKITNGAVFKCPVGGNCVAHTINCKCDGNEYNGYCYPKDTDPMTKVDDSKVTCVAKMMNEGGYDQIIKCFDGTCRTSEEECETKFECPVGYKVCANKCILLNEKCELTNECTTNQVVCWDMSCAEDYASCPTRISCATGKVLCPDKTCRLSGHCVQPNERFCAENEYQCPDFSCVKTKSDCGKNIICDVGESLCEDGECRLSCADVEVPQGKYRCQSGAYVDNIQLCPTVVFQPENYVKCSSGGIAKTKSGCDYVQGGNKITCPKTKPILCPDFECVEKSSDCSAYVPSCPTHKPYQCWNNECRTSFNECPTQVTCPSNAPVLCSSGLCEKSVEDCKETQASKCPEYRCFDGTCAKSMELCPTHTYCGEDAIKCWNGACVAKISECPNSLTLEDCSSKFPYRCPDGSCRGDKRSCSTISVCPSTLPIKCFDNSCRASTNECPDFQTCGEHKLSCPDGTCAKTLAECNTAITCYTDKPYLCFDGSCSKELSECPTPPICSKTQVLCPNGECLSSRQNCKIFEPCESTSPIRCEMNTCTETIDQCSTKQKRCPIGYTLCANGDCRTSESLCDNFVCPQNKLYKCPEGVCVHDKSLCDNQENGCPYNRPNRCPDGTCVVDISICVPFNCTKEDDKICPDGSCVGQKEECPTINGCYADRPYKCADGTCINPENTNCTLALCPFNKPIQCPNGNCVSKTSECSVELRQVDKEDCEQEGLIMCVDGRCVVSSDYCRPFFDCEAGYTRCGDGSCRVSPDLCPKNVQCPSTRPIRCSNEMCVEKEDDCINLLLCPTGYVRCSANGACVKESKDCPSTGKKQTGCPNKDSKDQVKCSNGRCLDSEAACKAASNACPDDDAPYLCSNGKCVEDKSFCTASSSSSSICGSGEELCPSGRCVKANNETKREQCTNSIGCPLSKPFRCSNGDCVYNYQYCKINSISQYGQVISNTYCDVSKPYLCDDKSCVSDYTFCKTSMPCEGTKCANGFCAKEGQKCQDFMEFCPLASPIQCPSGTCVSNIVDCAPSSNAEKCEDGEFYCTRLAKCLTSKLDCLVYYDTSQIVQNSVNRRLFENFANPLENKKEEYLSLVEEESTETSSRKGVICYDGTLAAEGEKCPIVPGCKMGQYRCENGGCAYKKENCHEETDYICPEGQMKCPDGFCHADCSGVAYHGCLVGQYQCSNGLCVKDEYDCIGYSMCSDPDYPYRCIDGSCKELPSYCPLIKRLGQVQNMTYSFNRVNKISFSFALDNNGRTLANIEIPGNGMNINNSNTDAYGKLYIAEVSSSILFDSGLYNDSAAFLFNVSNSVKGSEGILTFENSVMSPAFKFYTKDKGIKFGLAGVVNILHNYYDATGINYTDYCLAKLKGFDLDKDKFTGEKDEREWECVQRKDDDEQTEFRINEFGIYAVILNPIRNKINYFGDSTERNFFLENVKIILIVFACIVLVLALIFYVFYRVTRYREKYHENRNKILLLQQQKQEYENMTTDIFGQTLGDNISGIIYKSNPCYSVTGEIKTRETSLEEEIERLQIQCKNVTDQNERLQKDIDEITEKYKLLSNSIENMDK